MARVVSWPQVAGADMTRAGWPGSNGSVTGTKATAPDGAPVAPAVPAMLAVAQVLAVAAVLCVALPAAGALEPPQPASKPIAVMARAAVARPPLIVLLPPRATGRPPRDCLMTLPPAPGPHTQRKRGERSRTLAAVPRKLPVCNVTSPRRRFLSHPP